MTKESQEGTHGRLFSLYIRRLISSGFFFEKLIQLRLVWRCSLCCVFKSNFLAQAQVWQHNQLLLLLVHWCWFGMSGPLMSSPILVPASDGQSIHWQFAAYSTQNGSSFLDLLYFSGVRVNTSQSGKKCVRDTRWLHLCPIWNHSVNFYHWKDSSFPSTTKTKLVSN